MRKMSIIFGDSYQNIQSAVYKLFMNNPINRNLGLRNINSNLYLCIILMDDASISNVRIGIDYK